jgi:hypothetical protein
VAGNVRPASSRRSDNPGPDHDDGPLTLPEQYRWSIDVAHARKPGCTGVQAGAGGVHGTAGRGFAGRPAAAGAILHRDGLRTWREGLVLQ